MLENFLEPSFVQTVKSEATIYTACGKGKIPFISVEDVAAVACKFLMDVKLPQDVTYVLMGPELFSYDQVRTLCQWLMTANGPQIAATFSQVLDRSIVHCKLSPDMMKQRYIRDGLPEYMADHLVWIENETAKGSEEKPEDLVEKFLERPSQRLREWMERNRGVWGLVG